MKFEISRASDSYNTNSLPCEKAVPVNKDKSEYDFSEFTIEINTLKELIELMEEEGKIVIKTSTSTDYEYQIIIYDDYIE